MRKREVEEEVERFLGQAKKMKVKTVVLFGSRARGNYTEESDCDICLIANDLPEDIFKRRYLAPSGYRFLSIFGFYPQEFLNMLKNANFFTLDVVEEGKILYDDGFFKEAKKVYQQVIRKYKLIRDKRGWSWDGDL